MKKFIFSLVALFTVILSANAQYSVDGHKFFDNWSIGTDGGITTNLHDWDTPNGAVWGIQLTKGVTPVVSFEFSGQLGFNNNANWNIMHSPNAVDNVMVLGSTKINLMNWFCGFNGKPRLFEIQARGGVGYMHNFYLDNSAVQGSTDVNSAVAKLGLDFDFNLGKLKAWTISIRPSVILRGQNGISGCDNTSLCNAYSHNAVGQLTCGIVYHFKTSNKKHHFTSVTPIEITKVVETNVEVPVEKIVEVKVEKVVEVTKDASHFVMFSKNSSVLTNEAKATLETIPTNAIVDIVGMASPEGTKEYNQKLSEARATNVADFLKSRGVKVDSVKGLGSTLGDASNRVVKVILK